MKGYYEQIIKALKANGYQRCEGGKGSHEKWGKGAVKVIVPHNCKSRHTANAVMKDAGIKTRF